MAQKRKTVGQASSELLINAHKNPSKHTVQEQMSEQLSEYESEVMKCAESFKFVHPNKDFFVVVLTKTERLMTNVVRNYFFGRLTCPTPDYDQCVYRYDHAANDLQFLWVIPSKPACKYLMDNALMLGPEEKQLAQFVFDFRDGTLGKLTSKLNNEENLLTNIIITEGTK